MSPKDIEVGKTYHNGNLGKRGTARKVLEMGCRVQHWDGRGTVSHTGVMFRQIRGAYKGDVFTIPLKSFAQWAKGIEEATNHE